MESDPVIKVILGVAIPIGVGTWVEFKMNINPNKPKQLL